MKRHQLARCAVSLGLALAAPAALARGGGGGGHSGSHSGSHSWSYSGSHSGGHSSGASSYAPGHSGERVYSDGTAHFSYSAPQSGGASSGSASRSLAMSSSGHKSTYAAGVQRDSHGRIARSHRSIYAFKKDHPCPSTGKSTGACPGYVIDHIQPLKRGGADQPYNMQWQTTAAAKAKDKTE